MSDRESIKSALQQFSSLDMYDAGLNLFNELGYNTSRRTRLENNTFEGFAELFIQGNPSFKLTEEQTEKWGQVELLFQLTEDEMRQQIDIFKAREYDGSDMKSYVFFAIEMNESNYTRSQLAQITREVNKLFPMPVMILFKHGPTLTLSIIDRRLNMLDEGKDVLKKVTLIKDICFDNPHRAHIEILVDLSFDKLHQKYNFSSFVELHNSWRKCLDTKELNKRFYQDLANWYFWAMDKVTFPDDVEKNVEIRNATSLIRLITRIIFIWFIKEKGLVPELFFNEYNLNLESVSSSNFLFCRQNGCQI